MVTNDTDYGGYKPDRVSPSGTTGHTSTRSEDMSTKAREAAGQVRQESDQLLGEAREKVQHEAHRAAEEARERGKSFFESQKRLAAEEVEGMANALRQTAHQLEDQHQESIANYTSRAAESLDSISKAIRDKDLNSLVRQAEDFGRRQPGIFLGSAVAVGFFLARFLKSSAERRETEYGRTEYGYYPEHAGASRSYRTDISDRPVTTTAPTTGSASTGAVRTPPETGTPPGGIGTNL